MKGNLCHFDKGHLLNTQRETLITLKGSRNNLFERKDLLLQEYNQMLDTEKGKSIWDGI